MSIKPVYCQLIYESGQLICLEVQLLTVTITRIACTQLATFFAQTTLAHRTNLITCELYIVTINNRSSVVLPLVFTCILAMVRA
ncbi:hypothetical protein SPFM9_00104 [Salmonella phage SPFM9]|nr:hypothetical protein SPFM9_00104 [Salmonella phage SPFM9]